MDIRRNAALLAIFFLSATTGCEQHTRHQVLNILFTGVPPVVEGESSWELSRTMAPTPSPERKAAGFTYVHGPYAARQCGYCHGKNGEQTRPKSLLPQVGWTRHQADCKACHGIPAPTENLSPGRIHGPAAQGACIHCHDPHRSENPGMLREDSAALCVQCHSKGFMDTEAHRNRKECTGCHDPHLVGTASRGASGSRFAHRST